MKRPISLILAAAVGIGATQLSGCGYNTLAMDKQAVSAAWAQVVNQYKRRYDLVPNLVNTVKGYETHEKSTLEDVAEARAKVGSIQVSPETVENPQQMQAYLDAQKQLGGALSHLIAVSENYPQLRASEEYQQLMDALISTEDLISTARGRYVSAVQAYDTELSVFPTLITAKIFGFQPVPQYSEPESVQQAPKVDFGDSGSSSSTGHSSSSN